MFGPWIGFLAFGVATQCPGPEETALLQFQSKHGNGTNGTNGTDPPPFDISIDRNGNEYILEVVGTGTESAAEVFAALDQDQNGFLDAEEMQQGFVDKDKLEAALAARPNSSVMVLLSDVRPSLESMELLLLRAAIKAKSGCDTEEGFTEGFLSFEQYVDLLSEDSEVGDNATDNVTDNVTDNGTNNGTDGSGTDDNSMDDSSYGWHPRYVRGGHRRWRHRKHSRPLALVESGSFLDKCLGKKTFEQIGRCVRNVQVKECVSWITDPFSSCFLCCVKSITKTVMETFQCVKEATLFLVGDFKQCSTAITDLAKEEVGKKGLQEVRKFLDFLPSCGSPLDCRNKLLEGPLDLLSGLAKQVEDLVIQATGDEAYRDLWAFAKGALESGSSDIVDTVKAASEGLMKLFEGDVTTGHEDVDLSGDICLPWVEVKLTDCDVFEAMRELFDFSDTRFLTDIQNFIKGKVDTIVHRFLTCLRKQSLFGIPTPFSEISVNEKYACMGDDAKKALKKVFGPIKYFLNRIGNGFDCSGEVNAKAICDVAMAISKVPRLFEPLLSRAALLQSHGNSSIRPGAESDADRWGAASLISRGSHGDQPESHPEDASLMQRDGACHGMSDYSVFFRIGGDFTVNRKIQLEHPVWRIYKILPLSYPNPINTFAGFEGTAGCRGGKLFFEVSTIMYLSVDFVQAWRWARKYQSDILNDKEDRLQFSLSTSTGFSLGVAPSGDLFSGYLAGGLGLSKGTLSAGTGAVFLPSPDYPRGFYTSANFGLHGSTRTTPSQTYPVSLTGSGGFKVSLFRLAPSTTINPPAISIAPSRSQGARPLTQSHDALCLDWNSEWGSSLWLNAVMRPCNGGSTQQWFFDGQQLKTARDDFYCLAANRQIGNLYMRSCKTPGHEFYPYQRFRLEPSTSYLKVFAEGFEDKCVDYNYVTGVVYMYGCHGGGNQRWSFQCYPRAKSDARVFSTWMDGSCLDYNFYTGNVYMYGWCHRRPNQQWYFDAGQLKTKHDDNKCLDNTGEMKDCDGSSSQQFTFNGQQIKHVDSGLCADYNTGDGDVYFNRCLYASQDQSMPQSWQRWRCRS